MTNRIKIISLAVLAVFTFLIAGEIAGFRVCHDDSIDLIHVKQGGSTPARDSSTDQSLPCQNDETPIEHVIHYSAGYYPAGTAFLFFPIPAILSIWNPIPLVPSVIKTWYTLKDQIFKSRLAFETRPVRAPPVTL